MSYSVDLRVRVINWVLNGKSRRSASKVFEVHYNTVKVWVKKYKETGECIPQTRTPSTPRKLNLEALRQDVQSAPDSFQSERASRFGVTQSTISKALVKMGLIRKKKRFSTRRQKNQKSLSATPVKS